MPHHAQPNRVVLDLPASKNLGGWPAPKKIIWRPKIHKMGCPARSDTVIARGHLHPTDWPRCTVSANFGVTSGKKIASNINATTPLVTSYYLLIPLPHHVDQYFKSSFH
jgi:hypothetical protein